MAGTRALFASVGASIVLASAAALTLLIVSALFAFGGWSGSVVASARQPALVLDGSTLSAPGVSTRVAATPVVLAPARSTRPSRSSASDAGATRRMRDTPAASGGAESTEDKSVPDLDPPAPQPPDPPAPAQPVAQPRTGDGVRKVGNDLSTAVEETGSALAQATAPLGPPVSTAVQQVLNAVAELLRRGTDGLGGTLDTLLAPR